MSEALSLSELESFDGRAPIRGRERRFLCPFCGESKPKDAAHRSLAVNTDTGAWTCHRCAAKGLLREWWTKGNKVYDYKSFKERKQAAIKAKFEVKPQAAGPGPAPDQAKALEWVRNRETKWARAFPGSPAADYLAGRGIPADLPETAGCGYAEVWLHWGKPEGKTVYLGNDRRVIFPVRDRSGNLVAVATRAIDPKYIEPKAQTRGPKSLGVFATAGALEAEIPIITEAAIDALSLALAGFPAIAIIGTKGWPEWLIQHCAFRTVLIAFDADQAGDEAADKLAAELAGMGARAVRLRPTAGKDWNEILLAGGAQVVRAQVAAALGLEEPQPEIAIIPEPEQRDKLAGDTCAVCSLDLHITETDRYRIEKCSITPEHYLIITNKRPGRPMGLWVDYAKDDACAACGQQGETYAGKCEGCFWKIEPEPAAPQPPSWNAEMAELLEEVMNSGLPSQPFQLCAGHFISVPWRWYESLIRDIECGPRGPRARTGALQADLKALRELVILIGRRSGNGI